MAGKTASHMPLYQIAELETAVLGAATGPGTGLVSLEKSSEEPVELGRRGEALKACACCGHGVFGFHLFMLIYAAEPIGLKPPPQCFRALTQCT